MDAVAQVFLLFAKLGLLSVGGGNAILAELQRESVGRGWLTHAQFTEAFAIGQREIAGMLSYLHESMEVSVGVPPGTLARFPMPQPTIHADAQPGRGP